MNCPKCFSPLQGTAAICPNGCAFTTPNDCTYTLDSSIPWEQPEEEPLFVWYCPKCRRLWDPIEHPVTTCSWCLSPVKWGTVVPAVDLTT